MPQQDQIMTRANRSLDHHKQYISETQVNNLRQKRNRMSLKDLFSLVLLAITSPLLMKKTDAKMTKMIGCSKLLQGVKREKVKNLSLVLIKLKIAE